jgi:hypothetical protein
MAANKENDIQVLIPYSDLTRLLEAPKRLIEVEKQLKHQSRQIGALRGQLIEVIDKLREK